MRYIQCDPCAVCQAGWYGDTCNSSCLSTNCKDNQCDRLTGLCTACPGNFTGDYCSGKLQQYRLLHKYTVKVNRLCLCTLPVYLITLHTHMHIHTRARTHTHTHIHLRSCSMDPLRICIYSLAPLSKMYVTHWFQWAINVTHWIHCAIWNK